MGDTVMTSVYNHYMSAYSPKKSDARLESHPTSELKNIYHDIIEMNKEAPLYLLDRSDATKAFAIHLKEDARRLQHTILNSTGQTRQDLFQGKVAFSNNEDLVLVKYIGNNDIRSEEIPFYELEIQKLAAPQINISNFLPCGDQKLSPGNYSFDVNINDQGYEFQFTVNQDDMNVDVQTKLIRLFNHSNIGISASLIDGVNDTAAIRLVSAKTGNKGKEGSPIFTVSEHRQGDSHTSVNYLGLNYTTVLPENARIMANGKEISSPENHLILDNFYELDLLGVSGQDQPPVTIGIKTNTDAVKDNIRNLVGGYNTFLQSVGEYQELKANKGKLSHELLSVVRLYYNELDAIGINTTETGSLTVDENLLEESTQSEDALRLLSPLKDFSSSLYDKGEQISRDPLNYTHKKIVAYKNPGKNFTTPYLTSHYSGFLFNYDC